MWKPNLWSLFCLKSKTMLIRSFFLGFSLWAVFLFHNGLCICGCPNWRRVGMDILPEDLKQMELGIQFLSTCLPYPLDQFSLYFTNLEITKGWLDILCISIKVVLYLLFSLSAFYLWIKWRRHQRNDVMPKVVSQTSTVSVGTEFHSEHTSSVDEMLWRMVANTSMMLKYLTHVCHHERKEAPPRQFNKKRKVKETKDDEEIVTTSPYDHWSNVETVMQEM
ncbi:PREDICTED: uncharacterized protein LOC109286999 [Gavialis gangeticus]|uniref:uncharacterized protein LOC109286999 n=1 Tax=Gavialis gangeticus TaxID=94835 RepID=UPI00092F0D72|nr:PREDICTED: uncharacterized protein LOC109286999 [Gavialis gangeticus]